MGKQRPSCAQIAAFISSQLMLREMQRGSLELLGQQ